MEWLIIIMVTKISPRAVSSREVSPHDFFAACLFLLEKLWEFWSTDITASSSPPLLDFRPPTKMFFKTLLIDFNLSKNLIFFRFFLDLCLERMVKFELMVKLEQLVKVERLLKLG